MKLLDTPDRFGLLSIVMHWTVAFAIVSLLVIGFFELYNQPRSATRTFYANLHVSIAMVALPVILCRIAWRIKFGKPAAVPQKPILMKIAAFVWRALLVLMVLQYFSGPAMVWIHKYPLDIFGIAKIHPPAPEFWHSIEPAFGPLRTSHIMIGWLLVGALVLHVGGALKHLIIDRDGTVRRMLVPASDNSESEVGKSIKSGDDTSMSKGYNRNVGMD